MTSHMIRRTYNTHGDHDYLTRMEETPRGWCPVWCADVRQAVTVTETYATDLMGHIAIWRDHTCPDGIKGVEMVEVAP